MVKTIFAAILILCAACGGDFRYQYNAASPINQGAAVHTHVYVDIQFGEADKISIDNAINAWNYVLNGYIELDVVSYKFDMSPAEINSILNENGVMILKINSDSKLIPTPRYPEAFIAGFANDIGGNMIYLVRDKIDNIVEPVMLHELGHILGSPDLDGQTLMSWNFSAKYTKCIDKRSMEEVAKYHHLDPMKLNYCSYYGD